MNAKKLRKENNEENTERNVVYTYLSLQHKEKTYKCITTLSLCVFISQNGYIGG